MTHSICIRLTALAVLAGFAPAGAARAQQKVDIRRPATAAVSVRLNGAFASVRVTGWERDTVAISGALGAGSRMEGGPLNAQGPVSGMKFYVEATDEAASRNNRLELFVPRNARVWVKGGSADIEANRVGGSLDLNIIGGSVRVNGKPRELIVESMDGAVTFTGQADFARIKTATGNIDIGAYGDDVNVTTISGNITVTESKGGPIARGRFESVTGAITFAADIGRGGDARFDTHSGAIELRLKPQADVDIDAATITGAIENSFTQRRPDVGREGRGMELGTSSGNGGASVVIRSFKGNVKLTTR